MNSISLKECLFLKSSDGEYVYHILYFSETDPILSVNILNRNLESLAVREWKVTDLLEQIESGTIINFKDDEINQ